MFRANGTNHARVIQVIETRANRGSGVKGDPVREITQYWDFEGNLLASADTDSEYLAELSMWESERLKNLINP